MLILFIFSRRGLVQAGRDAEEDKDGGGGGLEDRARPQVGKDQGRGGRGARTGG